MFNIRWIPSLILITFLVSACSGDDGNSDQPDTNASPVFTSGVTAQAAENNTATNYDAAATDVDGDTLRYSVDGGEDANAFTIDSSSGALSFTSAPDYENPADSNSDNVYMVQISAFDGQGGSASISVAIAVTDVSEQPGGGVVFRDKVFSAVDVIRNVQFGEGQLDGGATQPLFMDIFSGQGDTRTDRPVLIVAFGGGFIAGSRDSVESIARDFALRGYVTATIDYRLMSSTPTTQSELDIGVLRAVHDMYAAVRFFREDALFNLQYGVRSDAIIVSGFSAGAVMAAIASITDEDEVSLLSTDTQSFLSANGGLFGNSSSNNTISSEVQGAIVVAGAIPNLDTIDVNDPPYYGAHEEFDPIVPCRTDTSEDFPNLAPVSGSCVITERYASLNLPNQLYLAEGSIGHIEFTEAEEQQFFDESAVFIYDQVLAPLAH